ncbi:MAG: hypothetical protein VX733_14765 [Candidatus Latescibacterota bacterium]|nr:hypothetical protein [Candidatus Latescibacterota bacterium]
MRDLCRQVARRAAEALSLSRPTTPLRAEEASVLLKYLVAARIEEDVPMPTLTTHARSVLREVCERARELLAPVLHADAMAPVLTALWRDPLYCERIIHLAIEARVSASMAPEVCICPEPRSLNRVERELEGFHHHGVVFAAAPLITHELYPLIADAATSDSRRGGPFQFNVVSVHGDWLDGGRAQRVLYYEGLRDRFLECALETPLLLHSAQFVALGDEQTERHRLWAKQLDAIPLLNNYSASLVADDKASSVRRWREHGIDVPRQRLLPPGQHKLAQRFAGKTEELVVKPNTGTEGECVFLLRGNDTASLKHRLAACWEWGAAVVEERRDGVVYRDPCSGTYHTLALRLHVATTIDGQSCAESGYAQIGTDADTPASRGRGGTIIDLEEALENLVRRRDGALVTLLPDDRQRIVRAATRAAECLGDVALVGVDLVLDLGASSEFRAVVVEANPRPAGLAHSRFLRSQDNGCERGVSLCMWDRLASLQPPPMDTASVPPGASVEVS